MSTPRLPNLELLKVIGSGSYGEVWLARTVTGLYRAVKIIRRSKFKDERPWLREFAGISRFQKELGGRPRQLALLHVGEDREQGLFYYEMELADDLERGADIDPASYEPATLKARRDKCPVMPAAELIRFAIDLTRALAELHAAGLVHRDVKPSNIIFVNSVPKLADLGLISSTEHSITSLGTPGYAPPEGSSTPRSDIYSLGKVVYELAMGLPSEEFPRLPPDLAMSPDAATLMELNEVLLCACNPNPLKRHLNAEVLLKELLHLQAGGSMRELARTKERLQQAKRLLAGLAVVAGCAGLVFGLRHYQALHQIAEQEKQAHALAASEARHFSYASDIHLARIGAGARDFGGVRSALRRQIPASSQEDLRGPEWWSLWNDFKGDATRSWSIPGRPQLAYLLWEPTGRQLVWQASNNERFLGLLNPANGESRVLASKTWRLAGPDHRGRFLTSIERKLTDIDPSTGQLETWPGPTGSLFMASASVAITGRFVDSSFEIHLYDRERREELSVWKAPAGKANRSPTAMDLSPDDRRFFLIYFESGTVRERSWVHHDLKENRELWSLKTTRMATCCAYSPNGQLIAVGGPGWTGVWLAKDGSQVWLDEKDPGQTDTLLWSADSQVLRSSGSSRRIRLQEANSGRELACLEGSESSVSSLALSPDTGALYAADSSGAITEYSAEKKSRESRPVLMTWPEFYGSVAFSRDGRFASYTDHQGHLALVETRHWSQLGVWDKAFRPLALAADGKHWLAMDRENRLVRCLAGETMETQVTGLACSPGTKLRYVCTSSNGRWTAVGSTDGSCEIWDLASEKAVLLPPVFAQQRPLTAMAFASDGSLLAIADDQGHLALLSGSDWKNVRRLADCQGSPYAATLDQACSRLALGMEDGRIQVLDILGETPPVSLQPHHGQISALTFTKDGRRLISGGQDGLLTYTDTRTWRPLGAEAYLDPETRLPIDLTHVVSDPTDEHLLVLTGAGEGRILKIAPDGPQKE